MQHQIILSDFDAGLHSSAAWNQHREQTASEISPSPNEHEAPEAGLPARALRDFEGEAQSSEISLKAGESIRILMEDVMDGWSLAKRDSSVVRPDDHVAIMGLIPKTHYTLTSELMPSPSLIATSSTLAGSSSNHSDTSPSAESRSTVRLPFPLPPIEPQPTGTAYNLHSLRSAFIRSSRVALNRFSSFVTTGTEAWILNGTEGMESMAPIHGHGSRNASELSTSSEESYASDTGTIRPNQAEVHYVETPPAWRSKTPPFQVLVHSPVKQSSALTGAYTLYSVTSIFPTTDPSIWPSSSPSSSLATEDDASHITVQRRFSQFTFLHAVLTRLLPGIALPPLPEKQYAGRFNEDFVEARRGDLERWLGRVIRHPLVRYAEIMMFFLSCESDVEWKRQLPRFQSASPTPGPTFYSRVFHPPFNIGDSDEAQETMERFQRHTHAMGKGVENLRATFGRVRETTLGMATVQRAISYSLLSLITSASHSSSSHPPDTSQGSSSSAAGDTPIDETDDPASFYDRRLSTHSTQSDSQHAQSHGMMNSDGAWCWREDCEECLYLTKSMQKTAESLQIVADLYDDHARRVQLVTHETMKDVSHPAEIYAPVANIHQAALAQYRESDVETGSIPDPDRAARSETVLNTTLAEIDTYHTQKNEDFRTLVAEYLDGEIEVYEQILSRLRTARTALDPPPEFLTADDEAIGLSPYADHISSGPRNPSIYERSIPRSSPSHGMILPTPAPLVYPAPHVFDWAGTAKPVANAVANGVGMLFSTSGAEPGASSSSMSPSHTGSSAGLGSVVSSDKSKSALRPKLPSRASSSVLGRFWGN